MTGSRGMTKYTCWLMLPWVVQWVHKREVTKFHEKRMGTHLFITAPVCNYYLIQMLDKEWAQEFCPSP